MKTSRFLLAALLSFSALSAAAQAWPTRQVRIVVPFPPGGSTDVIGRRIAEKLQAATGQVFIVENKPGAGGAVGSAEVARATPDGHTLVIGVTGSHAVSVSLNPALPYHPLKDFEPVTQVVSAPLVIVANPSVQANDLKAFIAFAKGGANLNHGTPGNGTSMHLTGEMFNLAAGTKIVHVPYKGSAAALNDLVGGQIQVMFGDLLVVLPQVRGGKVKALAVTSARRHPMLPEVPTVEEAGGYAGFEALSWQGLFAPAGTPREVVARLNQETVKALGAPDMQDYFAKQGFFVGGNSPEAFRAFVEREIAKWGRIVKEANVKVE